MFDARFEVQVLCFCGFGFFGGVRGDIFANAKLVMHILKLKCYVLWV